ncbi:MAG: hypothetical protein JO273_08905 [Methylobacteriaceae bacterium]|nr:hypothetical protein [Methylobacteriaceae bacterium]
MFAKGVPPKSAGDVGEKAQRPRMAKPHSKQHAAEYERLGWTLKAEFYADPPLDDEPYEYFFVWEREDAPLSPSTNPKDWER